MNSSDAKAVFGNVLGESMNHLTKAFAEIEGTTGSDWDDAYNLLSGRMLLLVRRIWVNGNVAIGMGADATQVKKGQWLCATALAHLPRPKSMSLLLDGIFLIWSGMDCSLTPRPHPFFKAIEDDFEEVLTQQFSREELVGEEGARDQAA